MKYTTIDGQLLSEMLLSGAYELESNKNLINSLNVFPVPDGDTGTNMSATMQSAASEIKSVKDNSIQAVADAASMGSLMGARGNSGVILSQLLRGISKYLKGKNTANSKDFALAIKEGVNTAYRAVMKPTEGTILTVARESADKGIEISKTEENITVLLKKIYEQSVVTLNKTPSMLPVLKQAGVVDAGGKGLVFIYLGMLKRLENGVVSEKVSEQEFKATEKISYDNLDTSNIKFGYCTEFFIKTKNADPEELKKKIIEIGDSIVVVGTENLIKVHIHTNNPGIVLQEALKIGELSKVKIDNMKEQHRNILDEISEEISGEVEETELKEFGIITVAMGDGITEIFKDLGADSVIEGGQTMNPSTQDILEAVNKLSAKNIFVLPNNGNIIMAAQQAKDLSSKNVEVIPSKSIPMGVSALIALNPDLSLKENINEMNNAMSRVKTGQVTFAVRDTNLNDVEIKEGNILGIYNGKLIKAGNDLNEVTRELIDSMIDDNSELITIFYGNNLEDSQTENITKYIQDKYVNCEVSINYGGQPLYYYIISVE